LLSKRVSRVAKRGTKEIRKGSDEGRRVGLTKDLRRVKHLHEQLNVGCVIIPDTQEEEEEEEKGIQPRSYSLKSKRAFTF